MYRAQVKTRCSGVLRAVARVLQVCPSASVVYKCHCPLGVACVHSFSRSAGHGEHTADRSAKQPNHPKPQALRQSAPPDTQCAAIRPAPQPLSTAAAPYISFPQKSPPGARPSGCVFLSGSLRKSRRPSTLESRWVRKSLGAKVV